MWKWVARSNEPSSAVPLSFAELYSVFFVHSLDFLASDFAPEALLTEATESFSVYASRQAPTKKKDRHNQTRGRT